MLGVAPPGAVETDALAVGLAVADPNCLPDILRRPVAQAVDLVGPDPNCPPDSCFGRKVVLLEAVADPNCLPDILGQPVAQAVVQNH